MAKRIKAARTGTTNKAPKAGKNSRKATVPTGKSSGKQISESKARTADAGKSKGKVAAGTSMKKNPVKSSKAIVTPGNPGKKATAPQGSTGKALAKPGHKIASAATASPKPTKRSSGRNQQMDSASSKRKSSAETKKKIGGNTAAAKTENSTGARKKASAPAAEKLRSVTPSGKNDQTFFELVFEVARQIPKGRVTSYGAIAASLGARSSSRLVGWAMNLAGSAKPKVPAHRVVNRNGMLSGKHHFSTPTQMQELLEREGVKVKNDTVVDFNRLFWDPMDLGE